MKSSVKILLLSLCGALGLYSLVSVGWADMDVGEARQMPYSGRLELDGEVVSGDVDFRFGFFGTAGGDASCLAVEPPGSCGYWWEEQLAVPITGGAFSVVLGSSTPLGDVVFAQPELHLAIAVRDSSSSVYTILGAKKRVYAVPFANRAAASNNFEVIGDLTVGGSATTGAISAAGDISSTGAISAAGTLSAGGNLSSGGRAGIGRAPHDISRLALQWGSGVGVFVGDRQPHGTALIETGVNVGTTHAWFGEAGSCVFNVTAGGDLFANGNITAANNTRGTCTWTVWFSEENDPMYCPDDKYVAGMQCSGSYCDSVRLYCCEL